MTATQPAILAVHNPIPTPKMDDRKRSLAMDVDDPPSRKRHVKDEAGQQMRLEADKEKDLEVSLPRMSVLLEGSQIANYVQEYCSRALLEFPERRHLSPDERVSSREEAL